MHASRPLKGYISFHSMRIGFERLGQRIIHWRAIATIENETDIIIPGPWTYPGTIRIIDGEIQDIVLLPCFRLDAVIRIAHIYSGEMIVEIVNWLLPSFEGIGNRHRFV